MFLSLHSILNIQFFGALQKLNHCISSNSLVLNDCSNVYSWLKGDDAWFILVCVGGGGVRCMVVFVCVHSLGGVRGWGCSWFLLVVGGGWLVVLCVPSQHFVAA